MFSWQQPNKRHASAHAHTCLPYQAGTLFTSHQKPRCFDGKAAVAGAVCVRAFCLSNMGLCAVTITTQLHVLFVSATVCMALTRSCRVDEPCMTAGASAAVAYSSNPPQLRTPGSGAQGELEPCTMEVHGCSMRR